MGLIPAAEATPPPGPQAALPHPLHRQAGLGSGDGGQQLQANQPHQLVLSFRGGIGVLGEQGAGHKPGDGQSR